VPYAETNKPIKIITEFIALAQNEYQRHSQLVEGINSTEQTSLESNIHFARQAISRLLWKHKFH